MRTRSNSAVVVDEAAEPSKRLRHATAVHEEVAAVVPDHEVFVFDADLALFKERLQAVLEKTREMLVAMCCSKCNWTRTTWLIFPLWTRWLQSWGEKPGRMFRLFLGSEWAALKELSSALAEKSKGRVRTLRLKQQRDHLVELRKMVIDLTVCDEKEAVEQTALVNECTQVL